MYDYTTSRDLNLKSPIGSWRRFDQLRINDFPSTFNDLKNVYFKRNCKKQGIMWIPLSITSPRGLELCELKNAFLMSVRDKILSTAQEALAYYTEYSKAMAKVCSNRVARGR